METVITKKDIAEYRRTLWREAPGTSLKTLRDAARFIDEVGMCLLFACRDIPLPKLYYCSADEADWWAWKDILQARKLAYNGRLVRRKATLVSMQLLPAFLAIYLTGGGYIMYEEEYYWGKLGQLANQVAEYLDRNGPTPVDSLRKAVVPAGKEHTRRFHNALFELQSKFKIVSAGLEDRSWGVRVLDLFVNWVPATVERKAEKLPRDEAIRRILTALVNTAGAVPEAMVPRLFGWSPEESLHAIDTLASHGAVIRGRVRGQGAPWLISPRLRQS
ncbi:MAG: hypothetical protein C4532_00465 [Candidatus Abyssobacteria bacterium SURF_17]|uniref:Winged helix-turn-helix domain-containing protein n=1 Tax=Candidatus Abyssobacteria bacterium SURF_17 TaxID=2093361 RepID=A0A419F9M9_9BACT|nr:MAG: hypothetical protein C4532_00465 [Candidatus Abyssubacteria bacterium SURF_17]